MGWGAGREGVFIGFPTTPLCWHHPPSFLLPAIPSMPTHPFHAHPSLSCPSIPLVHPFLLSTHSSCPPVPIMPTCPFACLLTKVPLAWQDFEIQLLTIPLIYPSLLPTCPSLLSICPSYPSVPLSVPLTHLSLLSTCPSCPSVPLVHLSLLSTCPSYQSLLSTPVHLTHLFLVHFSLFYTCLSCSPLPLVHLSILLICPTCLSLLSTCPVPLIHISVLPAPYPFLLPVQLIHLSSPSCQPVLLPVPYTPAPLACPSCLPGPLACPSCSPVQSLIHISLLPLPVPYAPVPLVHQYLSTCPSTHLSLLSTCPSCLLSVSAFQLWSC